MHYAFKGLKQNGAQVNSTALKLVAWNETAIPESRTVIHSPGGLRKRLQTSNGLERIAKELR